MGRRGGQLQRLGAALRLLRQQRRMRQQDLALAAGVNPVLISSYESGRCHPRISTLDRLLQGLNADLHELADAVDRADGAPPASRRIRCRRPSLLGSGDPETAGQACLGFLSTLAWSSSDRRKE